MRFLSTVGFRSAALLLIAVQLSCGGGDSSAPPTATSITANSTTALAGAPGMQVTDIPSVIVRDQSGSPMRGVAVAFVVTSGGGSVTGAAAVSDSIGRATVGSWTLGTLGLNTLTATAAGLPPVTFTAMVTDPCATAAPHVIGSTSNGDLTPSDCQIGTFVDQYTTSVATAGAYRFSQTSNSIDVFLVLFSSTRPLGAGNSNEGLLAAVDDNSATSTDATIKAFLPAASYTLVATSFNVTTGPYTLSSASVASTIANCELVFAVAGISMTQVLQSTDCVASGFYSDKMYIFRRAGQAVTISMSSTEFDARLDLLGGSPSAVVATNEDSASGNAQIVYTPTADGYFVIVPTSTIAGATGGYTLTIQ